MVTKRLTAWLASIALHGAMAMAVMIGLTHRGARPRQSAGVIAITTAPLPTAPLPTAPLPTATSAPATSAPATSATAGRDLRAATSAPTVQRRVAEPHRRPPAAAHRPQPAVSDSTAPSTRPEEPEPLAQAIVPTAGSQSDRGSERATEDDTAAGPSGTGAGARSGSAGGGGGGSGAGPGRGSTASARPRPFSTAGRISKARPARLIWPTRSAEADRGTLIVLTVTVDDDGFVTGVRVKRGVTLRRDEQAADGAWKFRYDPARDDDGRPIRSVVEQPVVVL